MVKLLKTIGCLEERRICSWLNNTDALLFLTAASLIHAALCQSCRGTNYTLIDAIVLMLYTLYLSYFVHRP